MLPRMLKWTFLVCLSAFFAGCATMSVITPDTLANIKKVGVVSLTAQEFYRMHVGFATFGNEYEKINISAWKVDDEYEVQMQNALAKLAFFEAVRVPDNRKDFYPAIDDFSKDPWYVGHGPGGKNWNAVEDKIKAFANANALDAVIFVVEKSSRDFIAASNQNIQGAGFYTRGTSIVPWAMSSLLHLIAEVVLIDGKSGKPLAYQRLFREFRENPLLVNKEYATTPMIKVDEKLSHTKLSELNKQNLSETRKMLIDLPKDVWEPTFKALLNKP